MSAKPPDDMAELEARLGLDRTGVRRGWIVRTLVWLLVVVGLLAGYQRYASRRGADMIRFETQAVHRGSLLVNVSATGNLEPRRRVDVGSELSGTIRSVEVDFNDRVTNGQILARLDSTRIDAQIAQAEASLEAARARLALSEATVSEASAQSERLSRLKTLSGGEMPAASDLDTVAAALARARADESASRAAIAQWLATLAAYRADQAKLLIRSPIQGTVLRRSAQSGQTVAATLQSPVLFTLAEDLARLDLVVDVDEADIGRVREGQSATFTVDAFPDRTFTARISQVRYGSQALDGVVTYKTVLTVENDDLTLRPGMTATATILIEKRADAVLVPNAALRFTPPPPSAETRRTGLVGLFLPRLPPIEQRPASGPGPGGRRQLVYALADGVPKPLPVTAGASDGTWTEVFGDDVKEGMAVITDVAAATR